MSQELNGNLSNEVNLQGGISAGSLVGSFGSSGGSSGTTDYNELDNKPQINGVTLSGDKSTSDLGLFSGDYDDLTNKPTIPTELNDLSDVDTSSFTLHEGDVLTWSGVDWTPWSPIDKLPDLEDTRISEPLHNGEVLKVSNNSVWVNGNIDYSEITNTPTIPAAQVNSDWNSNSGVSEILNKPTLATVATSGDYDDLTNKPTIPAAQVNSDWNSSSGVSEILNKPTLATVATSGDYDDLTNKPTIPAAQVNSDWNSSSGLSEILNKPTLATVATSGSYNDLTNKPTIPDGLDHYSTSERQVGVWVDGTTPIYEKTYTFNTPVTCSAGNTSAAGAWTSLVSWQDKITIIDFKAYTNSGNDPTIWGHLSAQWSNTNKDIRVLNIRSSAANVDGFIMRYFYS